MVFTFNSEVGAIFGMDVKEIDLFYKKLNKDSPM